MSAELLISRSGGRTMTARREDGHTVELRADTDRDELAVGQVVKARVSRVLPGIQSAFVEMGPGRDAFLHATDVVSPAGADRRAPIEKRLETGAELLVQVVREASETKGARVTCEITLPGRFLAYLPHAVTSAVSRRIREPEERARLAAVLEGIEAGGGGFIARTAARTADAAALVREGTSLVRTWTQIVERASSCAAPTTVHRDVELGLRVLRDEPASGLDRVLTDDPELYRRAAAFLGDLDPELVSKLRLHSGPRALFETYGIDQAIARALRPRVWLRSGGYILVQPTEALVSIDVNTGKFLGERDLEKTALRTNLEACREIARQLRLRDLGGIIVVDFIDMSLEENRQHVLRTLQESLRDDRARTKLVGMSELGLAQLTRKRTRAGFETSITTTCPVCHGKGRLKSPDMVAAEALSEVRRLLSDLDGQTVVVRVHPEVGRALSLLLQASRSDPGGLGDLAVRIEDDPGAPPDRFDVLAY